LAWPIIKGTAVLKALNDEDEGKALLYAAEILKKGGLVAFPTETVYGLGGDALNPGTVQNIYKVKQRPPDNPLIIHVAGMDQAARLVEEVPPEAFLLAENFWPGPLTMVLPKKNLVPDITTAGLSSAAIRVPAHPLARKLIRAAEIPLAAPSANLSGRPSPTTAEHVLDDLAGRIEAVLDGGSCSVGVESTVISLLSGTPALLRPGGITLEMLEDVLKQEVLDLTAERKGEVIKGAPPSPGMKYRHYAPRVPLYLVVGDYPAQRKQLVALTESFLMQGRKVALLLSLESAGICSAPVLRVLGSRNKPEQIAKRLFAILREMDFLDIDVIVVEGFDEKGMGRAVMNRLRKAAAEIIITEGKDSTW
jgi:L-threonylcarbamoyladenylate synthase